MEHEHGNDLKQEEDVREEKKISHAIFSGYKF